MDWNEQINQIKVNRKYRHLELPDETILDVLRQAEKEGGSQKIIIQKARKKIHNIVAAYLGDINYTQAKKNLIDAFQTTDDKQKKQVCREILSQHDTTKERLVYYQAFFEFIITICGYPRTVLDLACGLNPFALPFSGFPNTTRYYAYDIHKPRVDLINHFFSLCGMQSLAECRDVLVRPPKIRADAAFLFQEAHRMEKRRSGSSSELIYAINAKFIFISLPARSLRTRHDLQMTMRRLMQEIISDKFMLINERVFDNEILFCLVRKSG